MDIATRARNAERLRIVVRLLRETRFDLGDRKDEVDPVLVLDLERLGIELSKQEDA
jgi:hypothetical protein